MSDVKAWFVSDIHISDQNDPRLKRFEEFLRARLDDETTHLFLVGDIFDLWVGGDSFFARRFAEAVALIGKLKRNGVEVIYFEGNHDLHLQKFWTDELGCRVETTAKYFDLGKTRVRVEHGDQMNPDDKGYLLLRTVLRTPLVTALVEALPGSIIQKIGNGMSRSSRKWTSSNMKSRDDDAIREMIRSHARYVFEEDEPFDLIVTGHVHTRDDYSWRDVGSSREIRSVGLGCWFCGGSGNGPGDEKPQALCLTDGIATWHGV